MLTPEDLKNLTDYQKLIFVTKDDFNSGINDLKESFFTLQTSVDAIAKDDLKKS
jgi:FKBP-type peptidyl-prolyl cis-trans isomerase (trigger factor)